jgi:hypothetical protein
MERNGINYHGTNEEKELTTSITDMLIQCPIPKDQILSNLGLFLGSKDLSRILFLDHIYKQIINTQGVVMDFGTRWGQNMAVFSALRGIYEPFNRHRKIIGFDTFNGFPSVDKKDGNNSMMIEGNVTVTDSYEKYLDTLMSCHEKNNTLGHIKKYDIVKGDAIITFSKYLIDNPETIISLAYFDFDLYGPTKECLSLISDRIIKGSVMAFDELNDHDSPGETLALMETFGLRNVSLKRFLYASRVSYFIVE